MDLNPANTPAFPSRDHAGLSRREYLAGMAMQALISNLPSLRREGFQDREIPKYAVQSADALITHLDATRPNDKEPKPCEKCGKDINAGKCECLPF